MAKHTYKFCFGPWNISEGQDPYGPPVRPPQTFSWKLAQLKKLGFDAMMFHDDDAVPDLDSKSESLIRKEAKELKKLLDGEGIAAEMVAPRLWFAPPTVDAPTPATTRGIANTRLTARSAPSTSPTFSARTSSSSGSRARALTSASLRTDGAASS